MPFLCLFIKPGSLLFNNDWYVRGIQPYCKNTTYNVYIRIGDILRNYRNPTTKSISPESDFTRACFNIQPDS